MGKFDRKISPPRGEIRNPVFAAKESRVCNSVEPEQAHPAQIFSQPFVPSQGGGGWKFSDLPFAINFHGCSIRVTSDEDEDKTTSSEVRKT